MYSKGEIETEKERNLVDIDTTQTSVLTDFIIRTVSITYIFL